MTVGLWELLHNKCELTIPQARDTNVSHLYSRISVGHLSIACKKCACTMNKNLAVAPDGTDISVTTANCHCSVGIRCVGKISFSSLASPRSPEHCGKTLAYKREREKRHCKDGDISWQSELNRRVCSESASRRYFTQKRWRRSRWTFDIGRERLWRSYKWESVVDRWYMYCLIHLLIDMWIYHTVHLISR